jgi:hypothetical protein
MQRFQQILSTAWHETAPERTGTRADAHARPTAMYLMAVMKQFHRTFMEAEEGARSVSQYTKQHFRHVSCLGP